MKIGYPCLNRTLSCKPSHTFRLKNYSEDRLIETVGLNLDCIGEILQYNVQNGFLFFRLSSDIVPFASHRVCQYRWQEFFQEKFDLLGKYVRDNNIRISMHPDQFTLLNSPRKDVFERSVAELKYHVEILDLMELDSTAKVQIHVGGVYGDKRKAIDRFIVKYHTMDDKIKYRLVIENDDRLYSLADCLEIHNQTGIPITFDVFHHNLLNNGESVHSALAIAAGTWKNTDGIMMVDYSSQEADGRKGKHAETIDTDDFFYFLKQAGSMDFDLMLEIKDKEISAAKALKIASELKLVVCNETA